MAKKYWEGDIKDININTDWGGDESTNGAPLPGSIVQQLIKNEFNSKVGYMYNDKDAGKVYFYSNKESYENKEEYIGFVDSEQNNYLEIFVDKRKNLFFSTENNKSFKWYFRTRRKDNTIYQEPVNVIYTITNSKNDTRTISRTISPSPREEDGYTEVIIEKDEFDSFFTNGKSYIDIKITGSLTKQVAVAGENEISIITINFKDKTSFNTKIETELKLNCDVNCTLSQPFYIEYFFDENSDIKITSDKFEGAGKTENYNYFVKLIDSETKKELEDGFHVCTYRLKLPIELSEYYTEYQRIEFVKNEFNTYAEPHVLLYSKYNEGDKIKEENDLVINGISQYNSFYLPYSLYNENKGSLNIKITDVENGNVLAEQIVSSYELINLEIQMLNYGLTKIKIEAFKDTELIYERFFYLNVKKSEMLINIATNNLRVDFNSVGKSNNDLDKKSWISTVKKEENATFNDDFDWSQGWTKDGIVVSKNSEIVFNYAPFPFQKSGENNQTIINDYVGGLDKSYTFEIEFKTQNVTNDDVLLCNMVSDSDAFKCGLIITGTQIKFTTPGGKSISTRFKSGEMIRAAIVVRPNVYVDEKGEEIFKGLVELYVNGVLSSIASYAGEQFQIVETTSSGLSSKNLSFKGSEDGEIVVKHIRTYMTALSSDSILNNYILYRTNTNEMLSLYNKNNILDINTNSITPKSVIEWGNIPVLVFIGRTYEKELAPGDTGATNANSTYHYQTLENTSDKNLTVEMDVVYYDPKNPEKNFKFVKAAVRPQGTSSMLYPKKNFRIYTQRSEDTRLFFSNDEYGTLTFDDMMISNFGENEGDERYELKVPKEQKLYSFKKNAQPVKCWCLKADFAETSSSHNTGIARLWGDVMKNSTVKIGENEIPVLKTNAQEKIEKKYLGTVNEKDMPDVRTTIDGFPIVVFAKKAYGNWEPGDSDIDSSYVFLGKYNFNNDKSTESVFGFCDIDNTKNITGTTQDIYGNEGEIVYSIDDMLDKYMSCVETLDNGNDLANFAVMNKDNDSGSWDNNWDKAFEFRYPEIPEKPTKPNKNNYTDESKYNEDYAKYLEDLEEYNEDIKKWNNKHLKPLKHFAQWVYDTRYCDVNGNILKDELQAILNSNSGLTDEDGKLITTVQELADFRQRKFNKEKWEHLDVWKVAAYYIYVMRFGAVDQVVKNSMLTSEGPFSYNDNGEKYGYWDSNDEESNDYGRYFKWYYINYDNDTIMGVKNDGSLAYGPNIQRNTKDAGGNYVYAGSNSTLWNNLDNDTEFQNIVRRTDKGITRRLTYDTALKMFDVEQVGKWCERIYNKDADYKYISPYVGNWIYRDASGNTTSNESEKFSNKLFMLQGSRIAHRHWWLYNRFNLFDGKWGSGDFSSKFIEIKCDYNGTGGVFKAIAGSDSYYGYSINTVVFGKNESGETQEYKYGTEINWKLCKNINIGDPIAIFGSMDISELNLEGISKNLSEIQFNGANFSEQNKLERLKLSIPDEDLNKNAYYQVLYEYTEAINLIKDNFEGKYKDTIFNEEQFKEGGEYFNSKNIDYDATSKDSPDFYCIKTISKDKDDKEVIVYVYFVKLEGKVRNRSLNADSFSLMPLSKLQSLEMRGYETLSSLDLKSNRFITKLDVGYSSIKSVTFSEGSRITEFYASDSLNTLEFIRCNNITLSNIFINEIPLESNGGINLSIITVKNSDGLNHSNNFRDFIINWINGDKLSGFKPLDEKLLTLEGIEWSNIDMNHINTLLNYKKTYNYNSNITGTLKLSTGLNYSQSDIEKIEELIKLYENKLNVIFGNVNILIEKVSDIVAKNNENYEGKTIGCTIKTIGDEVVDYSKVRYTFLKEVTHGTGDHYDATKNKTYKEIDPSEIRGINNDGESNVTLSTVKKDGTILLKTEEVIIEKDVDVILGVIYENQSISKFDVTRFKIKDPTYAVKGELNGQLLLNEINTEYVYDLNLKTKNDKSPIGTVSKKWSITFENEEDSRFIVSSGLTSDDCRLTILTSDETPSEISRFTITVEVLNKLNKLNDPKSFVIQQTFVIINNNIIMTNETNPTVMTILKNNGIISETSESLSKEEAANITNAQIKTIFKNITDSTWSFDEFSYFTGITNLQNEAFKDSKLTSIKLPDTLREVGKSIFENCTNLKNITLSEGLESISEKMFLNCSNLNYIIIPTNIKSIGKNAFGNVGFKKILFNDENSYDNKTIYVYENSSLNKIENTAFEIETIIKENNVEVYRTNGFGIYNGTIITNNSLEEVYLPKNLELNRNNYQYLLGVNINKIILSSHNTNIVVDNNIIYVDEGKTTIARGLPLFNGEQIEKLELPSVNMVLDYAFFNCNSIKEIVFKEPISQYGIGPGAFLNSKFEVIDLSDSKELVYIQNYTFYNIETLKKVLLPMDGKLIIFGTYIFKNSPELEVLDLPNTLLKFEGTYSYFLDNCGIKKFTIPDKIFEVPMYFITNCKKLEEITYSPFFKISSRNSIVSSCIYLNNINLPLFSKTIVNKDECFVKENGHIIGWFDNTSSADSFKVNLKNLYGLDSNLNESFNIDNYTVETGNVNDNIIINYNFYPKGRITTFEGCYGIDTFTMHSDDNNKVFTVTNEGVDGVEVEEESIKKGKTIVRINDDNTKTLVKIVYSISGYTIPSSVSIIEYGAFAYTNIKEIIIPNTVKRIGTGVFQNCNYLTKVTFNNRDDDDYIIFDESADEGLFANCFSLTDVVFNTSNITSIPIKMFYKSGITGLTVPDKVQRIGNGAFSDCVKLTSVTFSDYSELKSIDASSEYGFGVFENCTSIKSIVLPETLEIIGQRSFFNCINLEEVVMLSKKLDKIEQFAFVGCSNLGSIKLLTTEVNKYGNTIPIIDKSNEYETLEDDTKFYKYHPFGWNNNNFTGINKKDNKFYIPFDKENDYKNSEDWTNPLLHVSGCNFTIETLSLKGEYNLSESEYTRNSVLSNYPLIYAKSESGKYNPLTGILNNGDNTFTFTFTNDVYDNETIIIYGDSTKKEEIGRFVVRYGKHNYILGDIILSSNSPILFNTNLFTNEIVEEKEVEMANITKLEYEMILAKIDQLSRLIKLKK